MTYYLFKVLLTTGVVVGVSELSRRSAVAGGFLASLPLTSLLAMIWLFVETKDAGKVADLSRGVFWLVLPSLALFLGLPWLIKYKWNFWAALGASVALTVGCYGVALWLARKWGLIGA